MSVRSHSMAERPFCWHISSCAVMYLKTGVSAVCHAGASVRPTPKRRAMLIHFSSASTPTVSPRLMRLYCALPMPSVAAKRASEPSKLPRRAASAARIFSLYSFVRLIYSRVFNVILTCL